MQKGTESFVITLTGPSGCGKSYIIDRIMELQQTLQEFNFQPIRVPKFVTRSLRSNEIRDQLEGKELDVIPVESIPDNCELKYQTYGKKYGLELKKLKSYLENGISPVVIINDIRVVEELKREFQEQVLSLFLFREVPRRETFFKEASKRGNVIEEETEQRYSKAIAIYRTYIENIGLFNRVILNPSRTPDSEDYAQIQIRNVIKGVLSGKISLKPKKNGKPKLFIIAGNAASGKDEIIQAVNDMGKLQANIIPKYTTRMQDEDDGNEMICQYIPKKIKMHKYENDYKAERKEMERLFEQRERQAGRDIDKLTVFREKNMEEINDLPKPKDRFWYAYRLERKRIEEQLRERILKESDSQYYLENLNLYEKSLSELCDIYKMEGYHREGVDISSALYSDSHIDEQSIINMIVKESNVEKDICSKKLESLNEKQLWKLYEKDGYHDIDVDVGELRECLNEKIMDEFFEFNNAYVDLEKISQECEKEISQQTQNQIFKVTGPAYYIDIGKKGLVMYENNKTLYGFEVCDLPERENFHYKNMLRYNKHCVLVASLIDIFKICKPFFDCNIVTVFSYSEISSKEFEKNTKAGTVDEKLENFEKEIKKYSEYIADFDHVTIYAESELEKRNGGRTEELIDQIFRLFRFYQPNDKGIV